MVGIVVKGISMKDVYEIYDICKFLDILVIIKVMEFMILEDFDELEVLFFEGE